jgi:hypothetical protein
MRSWAYLAVVDRVDGPAARDDIRIRPSIQTIGASRPSAVRALLARSVTMTALAIERRVRIRLRRPDTRGPGLPLVLAQERRASRARHEQHLAQASAGRTLFSIR